MQSAHATSVDDKFNMNFGHFDADSLFQAHLGVGGGGLKRSATDAGISLDDKLGHRYAQSGVKNIKKEDGRPRLTNDEEDDDEDEEGDPKGGALPNGKKTKGRVKIKMEFIDNKLRRYTTFSKRKTGIMKKAYELSTLTGTQVMLLVASETGHVYTFATRKLQPMITSEAGKALIQTCLNSPDPNASAAPLCPVSQNDQRMSATGYEETEITYAVPGSESGDEERSRPLGMDQDSPTTHDELIMGQKVRDSGGNLVGLSPKMRDSGGNLVAIQSPTPPGVYSEVHYMPQSPMALAHHNGIHLSSGGVISHHPSHSHSPPNVLPPHHHLYHPTSPPPTPIHPLPPSSPVHSHAEHHLLLPLTTNTRASLQSLSHPLPPHSPLPPHHSLHGEAPPPNGVTPFSAIHHTNAPHNHHISAMSR